MLAFADDSLDLLASILLIASCTVTSSPGPRNPPPTYDSRPNRPPPDDRPPPPPDRPRPDRGWDSAGWTLLGEKTVDGKTDLRAVQFKYSNLPGGGRARVQVWMQ